MPTLHLICGYLGSGKTTFAKQLEHETGGVRFSIDEWMIDLFGQTMPREEFNAREAAIKRRLWPIAVRTLGKGIDVILDYGFWPRSERDDYRRRGEECGAEVKLHLLRCNDETAWRKLEQRNRNLPAGDFEITREMFDSFRKWFEEPEQNERPLIVEI